MKLLIFTFWLALVFGCSSSSKKPAEVVKTPKKTKSKNTLNAFDPYLFEKLKAPEFESSGQCINVAKTVEKESGLKMAGPVYEMCCRSSTLNPTNSVECEKVLDSLGRLVMAIRPGEDKKGKFSSFNPFYILDWRTMAENDFRSLHLYDLDDKDRKTIRAAMDQNKTAEFYYRSQVPADLKKFFYYTVTPNGIEEAKVSELSGVVRFYKTDKGGLSVPVFDGSVILTTESGQELSGYVIISKEKLELAKAEHTFTKEESYRTQFTGEIDGSVLTESWNYKVYARPYVPPPPPQKVRTAEDGETVTREIAAVPPISENAIKENATDEYIFVDLPKAKFCKLSHLLIKTKPGRSVVHENFSRCD